MADLSGQDLGRYHLIERLGEGGMAVVYRAFDTRLERDVAIKIIRSEVFPIATWSDVLKRFEREAKSLARLSHPNIVKVHDYGEHEGAPFLVMEYLSGGTLKRRLGKPVPWKDALRLLLPIARGVAYAHQHGVLHRDIKPSNILMSEGGEPMLSDFGIAKLFETDQVTALTGTGSAIGTPEYMAPEQWTGKTGPQSDLYSLGITLYEMLTGRKPFIADTPAALLIKQVTEPLPSPRKFVAELPESLEEVLIKALAKEPEDRYQSISAFIDRLESLNAEVPIGQPSNEPRQVEETIGALAQKKLVAVPMQVSQPDESVTQRASSKVEAQGLRESFISLEKTTPKPWATMFSRKWMGIVIAGIVVLAGVLGSLILRNGYLVDVAPPGRNSAMPIPTNVSSPVKTSQSIMIYTRLPTSSLIAVSPTETITSLPVIPTLGIGSIMTGEDGMTLFYVPAGEFTMGSNGGDLNEKPIHRVYLDAFWIDQTEVTNVMYAKCVDAGKCNAPGDTQSSARDSYYGNAEFDNYPVIYVSWNDANDYCKWVDRSLPTEAQWEKAARGENGLVYPWGNEFDGTRTNFCDRNCPLGEANQSFDDGFSDTSPVGNYKSGASPYQALDMCGNVWEWVADWYSATGYSNSPDSNPKGADSGYTRVIRGGSWSNYAYLLRSTYRKGNDPLRSGPKIGFRCAMSANQ
jgi:eukaryotic-like serine/threonine-protein kinase